MIKNYEIKTDYTILYIPYKNLLFEVLIDTEDLQRILEFRYSWGISKHKQRDYFYAVSTKYIGKNETNSYSRPQRMNRFILNYTGDNFVDHINLNSLDNRKSNLRIATNSQNLKNRIKKNKNNKTGYRNVCFVDGWYIVQLQINGKNKIVGKSKDVHDAGRIAEELRKKYYGDFSGES